MNEETEVQEVIELSRAVNSHETAELEIQVLWCSPNPAGNEKNHEHRIAYIYVVSTSGQALCKHPLIYSYQQP